MVIAGCSIIVAVSGVVIMVCAVLTAWWLVDTARLLRQAGRDMAEVTRGDGRGQ